MRPNSRWENQVCLRNIGGVVAWGKINYIFAVFYPKQLPMLFIPALARAIYGIFPRETGKCFAKKDQTFTK